MWCHWHLAVAFFVQVLCIFHEFFSSMLPWIDFPLCWHGYCIAIVKLWNAWLTWTCFNFAPPHAWPVVKGIFRGLAWRHLSCETDGAWSYLHFWKYDVPVALIYCVAQVWFWWFGQFGGLSLKWVLFSLFALLYPPDSTFIGHLRLTLLGVEPCPLRPNSAPGFPSSTARVKL